MIEINIIDTNNFKTLEEIKNNLMRLSQEGWRINCSFGKKNQFIILRRKISFGDRE